MDWTAGDLEMTVSGVVFSSGNFAGLNLKYARVENISATSLSIEAETISFITSASYVLQYQRFTESGAIAGPEETFTTSSIPAVLENLYPGGIYTVKIKAKVDDNFGNTYILEKIALNKNSFSGAVVSGVLNKQQLTTAKSYFELSYYGTNKNEFAVAYKTFDSVEIPSGTVAASSEMSPYILNKYFKEYNTSPTFYSFGTSIFMDSKDKYPQQSGGLGFFLNNSGTQGYYILVEPVKSSASSGNKTVRIVKTTPNGVKNLYDTQVDNSTTFANVLGGKFYNIDVKVKVYLDTVTIKVKINGFTIVASDKSDLVNITNINYILPPTQTVGLIALKGKTMFDYVYANTITEEKYSSSEYNANIYNGQFSNDLIDTAFGDILYNSNVDQDELSDYKTKTVLEEFGSVVREIGYVKTKFSSRPAFPISWSIGNNEACRILGSKISTFGGESYILNNTSTTVPLSDNGNYSYYVYGNQLGQSGELSYSTDEADDNSNKEPVIFTSKWLQNQTDVKKLADWIKTKVINRSKILQFESFGNPLISVGDIVQVKYVYQGLEGTEKFVVTSVIHRYSDGLETSIVCRTL